MSITDQTGRGTATGPAAATEVEVLFHLTREDGWPPFDDEAIQCELIAPSLARLVAPPYFATDVSRGDTVRVHHDGAGRVAGEVVARGGHSTVHVVAAQREVLTELSGRLSAAGAAGVVDLHRPLLTVDVPRAASLAEVCRVLDAAVSVECNYAVSCRQHDAGGSADASAIADALTVLAAELRGRVVRPGDDDWDTARAAWNVAIDQRPEAVVFPADAADVAEVINVAAYSGLRVAPQSGAHNAAPLGDLRGTLLLRTTGLNGVEVDVAAQRVRCGAGVVWGDVTAALTGTGLAALAGSSPDVGVAGYVLGGGYSWLGRRYGLAASSVTAAEVVTGDGQVRWVDATNDPELFWAVRGGGGNGVVLTRLELRLFPVAEVYAGSLFYPISRAAEVLTAFEEWTRDLDESATLCARLLRLPPLPELPDSLRGQAFVGVDGAIDAPAGVAERLLAPMRALGPSVDLFGLMPVTELGAVHMDPPEPTPCAGNGMILDDLPAAAIDALLAVAGPDVQTSLLAVDIRLLGGALGRPAVDGGAVNQFPGRFLAFAVGVTPDAETHTATAAEVEAFVEALAPWTSDRTYANFSESSESPSRFHAPEVLRRLTAVVDRVDPHRVVRANHPID